MTADFKRKCAPCLVSIGLFAACSTTTGSGGAGLVDVAAGKDIVIPTFGKDLSSSPKDAPTSPGDAKVSADVAALDDGAAQPEDVAAPGDDAAPADLVAAKDAGSSCGDGKCSAPETCASCSADCGQCPDLCGDGKCAVSETCSTCPGDCGPCPVGCGDGKCASPSETCATCPADCGGCPGTCNPLTSASCKPAEQCYVASKAPVCALPGTLGLGAACKAVADCAKGMLCIDSACRPLCDAKGTLPALACKAPAVCVELTTATGPLGYNLGVCLGGDKCNLLSNGCPTGLMCVPFASDRACVTEGTIAVGGDCTSSNTECNANGVCLADDVGTKKHCKQKCGADGSAPTCTGLTCGGLSIGDPPKSVPDNLGACL